MNATRLAFLFALLPTLPTAASVYLWSHTGHPVAYVGGSALTAAVATLGVRLASTGGLARKIAVLLGTVLLLPLVAGLGTGFFAGLAAEIHGGDGLDGLSDGIGSAGVGTMMLYPGLAGAAIVAIGLAYVGAVIGARSSAAGQPGRA